MKNIVIGYVYDEQGFWERRHYFEGSATKVATFLYQFRKHTVVITDTDDCMLYHSPRFTTNATKDLVNLISELVIELVNHNSNNRIEFIENPEKELMDKELLRRHDYETSACHK